MKILTVCTVHIRNIAAASAGISKVERVSIVVVGCVVLWYWGDSAATNQGQLAAQSAVAGYCSPLAVIPTLNAALQPVYI